MYNESACQAACEETADVTKAACEEACSEAAGEYPGIEYEVVGLFIGNIIQTLRMSLGDFGFDAAMELEPAENYIYWVIWILIILVTCIIFLNFIIAEASASYEKVSEFLQLYILAEKAALIQQAEEMVPRWNKNQDKFPSYIIIREKED